jgi:hypothetical protein
MRETGSEPRGALRDVGDLRQVVNVRFPPIPDIRGCG